MSDRRRIKMLVPLILVAAVWPGRAPGAPLLTDVRFSAPGHAPLATASDDRLAFSLPRTEPSPTIDGVLDEPCWRDPRAYLGKFRLGLTPVPARHTREAWAAYDDRFLYIAVRLERKPDTQLRVATREPDNAMIWEDDEIELFFDPFSTGTDYCQIILNSEGVLFDAAHSNRIVPDPGGVGPNDTKLERQTDLSWSSGLVRRISVSDDCWTAELALPFDALGLTGAPAGHRVAFNITSADWDTKEYTCLSPTSSWHDPRQFGAFILGAPAVEVSSLQPTDVGTGRNIASVRLKDLTGKAARLKLEVDITTEGDSLRKTRTFLLPANSTQRFETPFDVDATSGPWRADIRIVNSEGKSVYAARRTGTIPPALTVNCGSHAVFSDAPPVLVGARIGLGVMTAVELRLEATLTDGKESRVATQDLGRPSGTELRAWMPVEGLSPERYQLKLIARFRGKVVAQAEEQLTIGLSPFADLDDRE